MKDIVFYPSSVLALLLETGARKAVKYINEKQIVRASRVSYNGKFSKGNIQIVLTIGRPNYREREFIKSCKKTKENFPIKKIQLVFLPKKKKK